MDFLSRAKRKCCSFFHREEDPDPFPIDAWTDAAYATWFECNRAGEGELEEQRSHRFSREPLFSFIVPLYKTPSEYLHTMVDSVLAQTYGRFELVLVNASPENERLAKEVLDYCAADRRVKVVELEKNYGITENTNRGISASSGDFLCFLDHDDYLEPNLLYEYALALNDDPGIEVLYCDEDLVSLEQGSFKHLNPFFKPSYSPELLLCKNYIVHLMTVSRCIVDEMPTPDSRYDGAQDYNMVLFATGCAKKVCHVPKVLYHWRICETSTASNSNAKPYSRYSSRISAQNQLSRKWPNARIVSSGITNLHNLWFSADSDKKVSVVAACESNVALGRFLELFRQTNSYGNFEIIATVPKEAQPGEELDVNLERIVLKCVPVEADCSVYARLNAAARLASGDYLMFCDCGCFFQTPEPLEQLVSLCAGEGIGAVAPKTLFADGSVMCYGIALTPRRIMPLYRGYPDDFPGYQCNLRAFQNASAVAWRGMTTPRALFEQVGGFDESFVGEIGAADYCKRLIDRGFRIVQTPTVKLQTAEACPELHYDNASNAADFTEGDTALFDAKWPGARASGDPYFNRNLDQASSYLQVANCDAAARKRS